MPEPLLIKRYVGPLFSLGSSQEAKELFRIFEVDAMGRESCELCGYRGEPGTVEKHHIVPIEVTERAGVPESRIIALCQSCHRELNRWYSVKVADTGYDTSLNRFRPKSPLEMVREYEFAFNTFAKYKQEQKKAT